MTEAENRLTKIESRWEQIWEAVLKEDHKTVYEIQNSLQPYFDTSSFEGSTPEPEVDVVAMIAYSILIHSFTIANQEYIKLPKIESDRMLTILKLLKENREL